VVKLRYVDGGDARVRVTTQAGQVVLGRELGHVGRHVCLGAGVDVGHLHLWYLLRWKTITGAGARVSRSRSRVIIEPQPRISAPGACIIRHRLLMQISNRRLDLTEALLCMKLGCVQPQLGWTHKRFFCNIDNRGVSHCWDRCWILPGTLTWSYWSWCWCWICCCCCCSRSGWSRTPCGRLTCVWTEICSL